MPNTLDKIRLSAVTYDIVDSTAVHSLDGYPTVDEMNTAITASSAAVLETVQEAGYQTSGDVQNAISGKVDTTTYTAYTASTDTALGNKADTTALTQVNDTLTAHTSDSDIHVTTSQTAGWDAKADISDIPSVTGYADSVMYNSTTKYVEFYHGTTAGTKVFEYDASPFLIDGMVESVVITSITSGASEVQVLEITWNSAAGGQVTDIPLSDIFDPTNYYTKSEVDSALSAKTDNADFTAYTSTTDTVISNKADTTAMTQAISEATSGKADTTAVTQAITEATSGKANSSDVYLKTETSGSTELSTAFSNKQDALVSQTNIKSINGSSILGSGDLTVDTGLHAEVTGTTLIFS